MLPSRGTDMKYIDYDIAQINSYYKNVAISSCNAMFVGKFYNEFEYRVLIKFNFKSLPENSRIQRATLSISVAAGALYCFSGSKLMCDWDVNNVNWLNQPQFNSSEIIFSKSVPYCTKYPIDITEQVRDWYKQPDRNYGATC
ncbi:hypothetical protein LY28_01884 [Ruminiclostridium sufflavum DSM 19573]|uniref:Carbohydrate-binding module family 96 domain-containing protein n=1 Tax=Ruminiclostridium sufflavum DSM 19573 TaxID=1121337 RepID=A0A318XLK8_9FIRM|nr:DNRLRE domain-containing protein [Ruminiclostridium sufflavum]PYG87516.1 hypothetical protein LY28_01884 [Ruminiclostridium sufflavum DSM 19573]